MDTSGIFEALKEKADSSVQIDESDYIKDGILYCGKCNTPKQARVNVMGSIITPMCLCKCEAEKEKAVEEANRARNEILRTRTLRVMGFADADLAKCTFGKDDASNAKLTSIATKYVANFNLMKRRGKGLLLYGDVGTGKTFMSACIANALIDKGHPCLVTNFARLTNTLQGMYEGKQKYLDQLNGFHLLVIDDLASERDTEYMNEMVQTIIDSRYRSGLPLIVTTNLTAGELKNPIDMKKKRIYSRLFEMCVPVEVSGKDRRREKLKADHNELAEVLGL